LRERTEMGNGLRMGAGIGNQNEEDRYRKGKKCRWAWRETCLEN